MNCLSFRDGIVAIPWRHLLEHWKKTSSFLLSDAIFMQLYRFPVTLLSLPNIRFNFIFLSIKNCTLHQPLTMDPALHIQRLLTLKIMQFITISEQIHVMNVPKTPGISGGEVRYWILAKEVYPSFRWYRSWFPVGDRLSLGHIWCCCVLRGEN